MGNLPEFEPNLVPEGHYKFRIMEEPEVMKTNERRWIIFKFKLTTSDGRTRKYSDVFFPGDEKYRCLLLVAGAEKDEKGIPHLSKMDTSELVGVEFEAEIVHTPDRKDPNKIRDTIADIVLPEEDVPPPEEPESEDEVPF